MQVLDLMKKKKLLSKEISTINFHMNLLTCDIKELINKFPELKDKNEDEIANFIVNLFDRCDSRSKNFDPMLDTEMTRLGLKTDQFYAPKYSNFEYDTEELGDMYDDMIDKINDDDYDER